MDESTWRSIMGHLKREHPEICRQWFEQLEPYDIDGGLIEVYSADPLQRKYLQRVCRDQFTEAAQAALGRLVSVQFTTTQPPSLAGGPGLTASRAAYRQTPTSAHAHADAQAGGNGWSPTGLATSSDHDGPDEVRSPVAVTDDHRPGDEHPGLAAAEPEADWYDRVAAPSDPLSTPRADHARIAGSANGADTSAQPPRPGGSTTLAPEERRGTPPGLDAASGGSGGPLTTSGETSGTRSAPDDRAAAELLAELQADQIVLSPDYAFDTFITGPNNQLAYAASFAVAQQPGRAYNPLFVHGGVGLGKTHLLQAICRTILQANERTQILYVSCEAFMNQFIGCVQAGKMNEFRHRYRDVDVLVIDDIHFLAGRERSQEEFFHTFNQLFQANKQIVLSSDAAPDEIPELEERLVSRFRWGLVAKVSKPEFETRVAIVQAKARLRGIEMPEEVTHLIARSIDSNARELEGAITSVQARANVDGSPITLDLARSALGVRTNEPRSSQATLQYIIDAVTSFYQVKLQDLQSRRRHKSITEPRQVCMWLARRHTDFSLEEIGGYFGGRDHTTVMHSIRTVDERRETEPAFLQKADHIAQEVDRRMA